jgi:hypothetical protein
MIDRAHFFSTVRSKLFGGKLSQTQVDGMSSILDTWEAEHATDPNSWLAYMLATAFHETAFTMLPIGEYGGNAYFFKMYDKAGSRPSVAKTLGNTEAGDGVKYKGRGYVQLTGRRNYTLMADVTKQDLVNNPDLALQSAIASKIMFYGMTHGTFTGKTLANYLGGAKNDWVNARRVINGLDQADKIAVYAVKFNDAIKSV